MVNEPPDRVMCPLVDAEIEAIECVVNRDCVYGELVISCMPDEFKQKENFKDICKNCEWYNYGY